MDEAAMGFRRPVSHTPSHGTARGDGTDPHAFVLAFRRHWVRARSV